MSGRSCAVRRRGTGLTSPPGLLQRREQRIHYWSIPHNLKHSQCSVQLLHRGHNALISRLPAAVHPAGLVPHYPSICTPSAWLRLRLRIVRGQVKLKPIPWPVSGRTSLLRSDLRSRKARSQEAMLHWYHWKLRAIPAGAGEPPFPYIVDESGTKPGFMFTTGTS